MRRAPAVVAALVACLLVPGIAHGHATLDRSTPRAGEIVASPPDAVTLVFTEAVEVALGGIEVFDDAAVQVGDGVTSRVDDRTVSTRLPANLADGTYTVSYRVLSGDGHPIDGAFAFHVGAPSSNAAGVADRVQNNASGAIERASGIARFLNVVLVVLLVGALLVTLLILERTRSSVAPTLWYVVAGLGFATSIVAAATVVLQSAIVNGTGLGQATSGSVLSAVLETRFGKVRLAEVILAEVLAIGAVWAPSTRSTGFRIILGALGVACAATLGMSGHAGARGVVAVVADTGHVLAASAWVGGLVAVMLAIWLARDERLDLARRALPRFSTVALVSVGALVTLGAVGTITHVGSVSDLWQTGYGRLLVAKILIAATLIGAGLFNRRRVRRLAEGAADGERQLGLLRRVVGGELAVMAAALVVTSVLIAKPPADVARAQVPPAQVAASTSVDDLDVRVVLEPGRVGSNVVHVYLTRAGAAASVAAVELAVRPQTGELGRFRSQAGEAEPGHYVTDTVQLAVKGIWIVDVDLRRDAFDLVGVSVRLPITPAGG